MHGGIPVAGTNLGRALIGGLMLASSVAVAHADGAYSRGTSGALTSLDPQKVDTATDRAVVRDLFEGLTATGPDGKIEPGMALSWQVSPNGLDWTFTLRSNARWSNGDPVTASDFVTALRRLADPQTGSQYAYLFDDISNFSEALAGSIAPDRIAVSSLDDVTLKITLRQAAPDLPARLAHPVASPVNSRLVAASGASAFEMGKLVTNGAFIPLAQEGGSRITMTRNPMFHGVADVGPDRVITTAFEPGNDCAQAFESYGLDSCAALEGTPPEKLKARFGTRLRIAPLAGIYYLAINSTKAPWSDARVRRALSLALDREALVSQVYGAAMLPNETLIARGVNGLAGDVAGYTGAVSARSLVDRRATGRALLSGAGFDASHPLKLQIATNTGEMNRRTLESVASQWKSSLGVEATIIETDAISHYAGLAEGADFDLARAGWIADEDDVSSFLRIFGSDDSSLNLGHYGEPAYRELIQKVSLAPDDTSRRESIRTAIERLAVDVPAIPLMQYTSAALVSPQISGWTDNVLDDHPSRFIRIAQ